jgi:Rap1a immunity proteins
VGSGTSEILIVHRLTAIIAALVWMLAAGAAAQQAAPSPPQPPSPAVSGNIGLGNVFYSVCKEAQRRGACSLYLRGIIEGVQVQTRASKQPGLFCPPQGASAEQALDLLLKFMTEKPEERHRPVPTLTAVALRAAWPCAKAPAPAPAEQL